MKGREGLPGWEAVPDETKAALAKVCEIIQALYDINELYEPNWALTMHVMKFLASILFSRSNEEHGVPLGGGENGKSWLMFVLERLLGEYACGIQAGVYGKPVPSTEKPNPDWLALMGRKVFLGGEKGAGIKVDAGTWKALRDPTNVIELRGLWEGNVKFRSAGRMIIPDNNRIEFVGGVDGGVRRSTLAWPHPYVFTTTPTEDFEKLARPIKTVAYVHELLPGLFYVLSIIDEVWSGDWISGQIKPMPEVVREATKQLLMGVHESNFADFTDEYCDLVADRKVASTPGPACASSTLNSNQRRTWRRSREAFVSPKNLHRVRLTRHGTANYIKLK
jgi:hypothetical protein